MRKIFLTILSCLTFIVLHAQEQKISVTLTDQPLGILFKEIEARCDYRFLYSDEVVINTIKISITANNQSVASILSQLLPDQQLFYQMINDRLIVIGSKKRNGNNELTKINFNGLLLDSKGIGIPFASIGLFEAGSLLGGNISGERGDYLISHQFLSEHTYTLKISSVGYRPLAVNFTFPDTTSVKRLIMQDDLLNLKTVNVTANKPLLERRTDRYIVNVEDSFLANGNNGLEVLQKSPGVWVGNDGSIKIRGNQSVMVMINDVVQRMSGNDLSDYLRTLRSEDISRIEIISSPPSEFEAEGSGGIIHIILKRSRSDGVVGTVRADYSQIKNRPSISSGLSLNYKTKSLYLFGGISGSKDKSGSFATNKINYPNQDFYSSSTDRSNNNSNFRYQFGMGYDIGKNQSIGLQTVQTATRLNQYFDTHINFLGSQPLTGAAHSEWYRKPILNGTTVNYVWKTDSLGSTFKVIGDYVYSKRTELNNFSSVYTLSSKNSIFRNSTPNRTDLWSIQTDYTKVLKKLVTFKTGLKFASTTRDNEVLNENLVGDVWVKNTKLSNEFIYKENLSMAYASLEKSWKKISVKAGLRAEFTQMDGNSITANQQFKRDYLGFFPSLFVNQKLKEGSSDAIYFSYSRRLQRPAFADLNPYRLQFDDYLYQLGNPDLTPEYTHKLEVGGLFWKGFSADLHYSLTTDKVAQLGNPGAGSVIEYQTRNFDNSYEYGFSLFAPIKFFKWWTMNTSIAANNISFRINDYQIRQSTLYARAQHVVMLKNLFDIDFAVDYRSPYVNANKTIAEVFVADVGLTKRFLNKKLQARIYLSDIFNTFREKDYTDYLGTTIDFYQKRQTQSLSFSLNYNFSSGKKFNNKKIEQSNDEEKRRIGN
jgi:hypothetical protein